MTETKSSRFAKISAKRIKLLQACSPPRADPEWDILINGLPVIPPEPARTLCGPSANRATSGRRFVAQPSLRTSTICTPGDHPHNLLHDLLQLKNAEVSAERERIRRKRWTRLYRQGRWHCRPPAAGNPRLKSLSDILKGRAGVLSCQNCCSARGLLGRSVI